MKWNRSQTNTYIKLIINVFRNKSLRLLTKLSSVFFWNKILIKHEVVGSTEINCCGKL